MDNASKALVMAGAILIAVMLISLGVVLFNTAGDIAQDTSKQLDSLAIETFNSGFIQMAGPSVKGSSVKTLINKVNSHNGNDEASSLYGEISINATIGAIKSNKYYPVDITEYHDDTGAIKTIEVGAEMDKPVL